MLFKFTSIAQTANLEWVKTYNHKTERKDLKVATDSEGYIYIAGTFETDSLNGTDWQLIKVAPNRDTIFNISIDGNARGDDSLNAILIDAADNIFLTGSFRDTNDVRSAGVAKVSSTGSIVWQKNYYPSQVKTEGIYLVSDTEDGVYVIGNLDEGSIVKVFAVHYQNTGTKGYEYFTTREDNEYVAGVVITTEGNLIIASHYIQGEGNNLYLNGVNFSNQEQVFTRAFTPETGENVWCNDMTADENGVVYVTGSIGYDSYNKNFVTIRFVGEGDVEWYAVYGGETGEDDAAVSIVITPEQILVCGYSTAEGKKKQTTISYTPGSGEQRWMQTYSSADNSNNTAIKIRYLGNETFIITGNSATEENAGFITVNCINADGENLWNVNAVADNSSYAASSACTDFLGNIYIAGHVQTDNTHAGLLIKINQPTIANVQLTDFLKMIAVGMTDASAHATVKAQVNKMCALTVDSFYHVRIETLIDSCAAHSYDLRSAMNEKIAEYFNLPERDWVEYVKKRFWVMGNKFNVLLAIPHYSHFDSTALYNDAKISYDYNEPGYPIPCLNCAGETINKEGTETNVTWTILSTPRPHYYINGDPTVYLTACTGSFANKTWGTDRCEVCTPVSSGQIGSTTGSSTGNNEIEIFIEHDGVQNTDDNCYNPILQLPLYTGTNHEDGFGQPITKAFARLSKLSIAPHYAPNTVSSPVYYKTLYKVTPENKFKNPIIDREYTYHQNGGFANHMDESNWFFGDVLTLCQVSEVFTMLGYNGPVSPRYALAFGLYKIDRPGINTKPVYFAFPGFQGIWCSQGPDMGIVYGNDAAASCPNGNIEIIENNYTVQCDFCGAIPQSLGLIDPAITTTTSRDYLATTDYVFFRDYWKKENITVGFKDLSGLTLAKDLLSFDAVTSPTTPTILGTTLVVSLIMEQTTDAPLGEYQIEKTFAQESAGTTLYVHVRAEFASGKRINEVKSITLNSLNYSNFGCIVSAFRGELKNYSSSVVNYQIDVRK